MENQPTQNQENQTFTPPRHWIGPEELEARYWSDPQIREKRAQEFFDKPIETIDFIDRVDTKGLARRDFLTVMGASMAMATFACARRPVNKIIPYVVKPEEITPGVATWYASTCKECESGCGVLIKNREGRPIKLEGNPDHPMNQGALCARGQASVLNLYDPDRLKGPVARGRADGSRREISWQEADQTITARLKQLASSGGQIRILSSRVQSPATMRLIQEFSSAFRGASHVEFDALELDEVPEAQSQSYGSRVYPHYRFDHADVIVSLGADFLGTWPNHIEYSRTWSKNRKLDPARSNPGKMSKMYCFEPTMTVTGSNADERFPIRPGDEVKIAMAIAHELLINQKHSSFAGNAAVTGALASFKPEAVAEEIGMQNGAAKIKKIAHDLWAARGRSLVVGGSIASKTKDALNLQLAVNLLNSALENDGTTVDGTVYATEARSGSLQSISNLIAEMKGGKVAALIVYRSNPAYTLPRAAMGWDEALKKVPLVITISDREDETGKMSDYVLPDHHYLENWGDASPRKGLFSLQQPAMAPMHSTRAFQDSLMTWSKGAGLTSGMIARSSTWHEYLKNFWKETVYKDAKASASFDEFWEGALRAGVIDTNKGGTKGSARTFRPGSLAAVKYAPAKNSGVYLSLYEKVNMHDGRSANNAWLQEMPDPISSVTWDNYVNVGPALAKKLGVGNDDVIEISAGGVSAHLPVYVQPGMHPSVVSIAVGYGRRSVGKVGDQAGVDVFPFVEVTQNGFSFSGQVVNLRKTQKFYKLAMTQWHTATENRPIINDITLAAYKKDPATSNHTDPELRMHKVPTIWPTFKYEGHRWGMAIDLNSCTGCSACVIACQAENNVPVVGRDQVRVSRQMHWLRIDRYYAGTPDNPDVLFQPMLCQHCENAPCETVCPVLATVHDDEGLNVQVYNRCVGTRYCQNNCPYKVRRFNFFDHWKSYEGTMNLVWNPDVTVRSRGIMEKCTFCVQRIRDAKDKAKDEGRKLRDGELKTACQQTCPTEAIVFGDVNDPGSRVNKLRQDPRNFRVLEVLNSKPMIDYLTKVRNKEGGEGNGHHG